MKNKILPIIAILFIIIAIIVIVFIPKNNKNTEKVAQTSNTTTQTKTRNTAQKSAAKLATLDEEGNVMITSEDVTTDKISFIRYSDESKIELIAIKGEDGKINVALGTCQSCNGSPKAYYTQAGDELKCNNCGLTFPLDVIGVDGTGCHPIMLEESSITRTDDSVKIDKNALFEKEDLFAQIVKH